MTQAYNLAILANAVDSSGKLNVGTNATGTLPVANGGSGQSALTANNVLLGNGTSGVQFVAPGTNGNVLTSNGTTWVSSTVPATGVTSLNGSTGALKGATLVNTTTFSGASTINVTSGISSEGNYLIRVIGTMNTTSAITEYYLRTSTNGGSSYNSGSTDYRRVELDGSVGVGTYMNEIFGKSAFAVTYGINTYILLYTGNASYAASSQTFNANLSLSSIEGYLRSSFGTRTASGQVNAFQITRITGSALATGTVYTYFLGI